MREAHSRSAHASIAGYLYQAYLGLERWLALGDKEVIVFEGDEDIDRLLLGTASGVSEQVKLRSGDLGAGVVRKCLRSFLPTYIALQKKEADRRYRFVSNADLLPGSPLRGLISALQAWSHLGEERQREVVLEWKAWLQPADGEGDAALLNAYRWLDQEEGRWGAWLSSLEFVLESPAIPAIRGSLLDALRRREDAHGLVAEDLRDRLLVEVLEASRQAKAEARSRTRADLQDLIRNSRENLAAVLATEPALRLRRVLDEVQQIQELLTSGSASLPTPHPDQPEGLPPGKLLTAAYEVIPFDDAGRQAEIAKLEAWCERGGAKPSIQLITGAGGMGKSRLMIEVCRRIAHQGWHSGFVPSGFEGDRIAALLRGNAPRLLVVDYAETRLELLRPLLLRLSALKGPKVRLVLLSRSESDWWPSLASEERPISDLLLSSPPHMELRPLVSGLREDRLEAFRAAQGVFRHHLPQEARDPAPIPELSHATYDRALYLYMAALATLLGEEVTDPRDALAVTLEHEERYWWKQILDLTQQRETRSDLKDSIPRVMAAVTLYGGLEQPTDEIEGLLHSILGRRLE